MLFRRNRIHEAVQALQAELAGGPRARLEGEVRELAALLAKRSRREVVANCDPGEQQLISAIPYAAALVSKEGWVRLSNAAFDRLAASGRASGLTPLEITRSAELSEAVKRALEGTARRLELAIDKNIYLAHLAPLIRGEVLLILRDVTDTKRADATRRDFVANASHELRTPITAIGAAAETLLGGALADPANARGFVEIVARNAQRLSRLSQDLLDLSRIETRQWRFEIGRVDASPLARQAIDLLAGAAREKGLAISSEVPEDCRVHADARSLEQVLVNLVDNAVKYTSEGSIRVRADRDEKHWILSVVDTGAGISAHHLPRLFERFYRVDPGRSREQGGTGLGLAIVKHLVQGMGGEVGVVSGDEGSRFWVRLAAA